MSEIIRIKGVQGSEPMVKGKYVPVSVIVALLQQGQTVEELLDDYADHLTLEDVQAALTYYENNRDEIHGYPAAHKAAREQIFALSAERERQRRQRQSEQVSN
jgi:uncharacterized protein (DUF433 family)